jgi:hypothetical protein
MELNQEQKTQVAAWIEEGHKLAQIQEKILALWNIRLTYMEARMLVDDLKLLPKDPPPPPAEKSETQASADAPDALESARGEVPAGEDAGAPAGGVSVTVDTLARPGAMVSGRGTFSDGNQVVWQLDQFGRFAMSGPSPGYRPPEAEWREFQILLDKELSRMGF